MLLSIIIPVFNEEKNIPLLYQKLSEVLNPQPYELEFIFVNDGSRDNSLALLRLFANNDPRVKYIDLSRNFGHQIAVTAGLEHSKGDAIVIIDADLQDPLN